MRDPEVEQFLAHTRLAGEGDAKADFERRVDVMREKLLASKGDEMKYSEDQPRGDDGRWGSGALAADLKNIHETALAKAKEIGHQPGSRPRFKKGTVNERIALRANAARASAWMGAHQASVEELAAKGWTIDKIREAQRDSPTLSLLSSRLPTAAVPFAGVMNRIPKSAPTGETKYSEDEPRDEHGRWGDGDPAVGTKVGRADGKDLHFAGWHLTDDAHLQETLDFQRGNGARRHGGYLFTTDRAGAEKWNTSWTGERKYAAEILATKNHLGGEPWAETSASHPPGFNEWQVESRYARVGRVIPAHELAKK